MRVAVTRSKRRVGPDRLTQLLLETGALPVEAHLTFTRPPSDPSRLERCVAAVRSFDWIVVTSARTVPPFIEALEGAGITTDAIRNYGVRICAVGPRTGEALSAAGLETDLVPERFNAPGVVDSLLRCGDPRGLRILFPRAEGGRDIIPRLLTQAGANVEVASAYRTDAIPGAGIQLLKQVMAGQIDALTFTAGSAARVFADAWARGRRAQVEAEGVRKEALPHGVKVIALGPATAAALEAGGIPVHRTAYPHTLEALVASLQDCCSVSDT